MTRTPAVMEIEPCPFCGGPSEAVEAVPGTWALGVTIRCGTSSCGAQQTGQTSQDAATKWNHRTPAEPLADGEIIEKLVREAYEEGVEDGMERGFDPTDGAPQWIDSVARIETLRAIAAAYNPNDRLREALEEAWTDFLDANPDDLNSPEEYPDHALVTFKQLVGIVDAALSHKD